MSFMTDNLLLNQLKTGENASVELLYKHHFPSISSYIRKNMGSKEDAEDIFQEAILVLLNKVKQHDFTLTSSLKTYLYAISKNLWLKRLRDNKLISADDLEPYQTESDTFSVELITEKSKEEQVHSWLAKITANCQRILNALFMHNESMESVMKKMGWKNKHTAANQQYKCIQQVKREKEKDF